MTKANSDKAFVYVATGDRYIKEAALSIGTVSANMPDIKIYLYSDKPADIAGLHKNIIINNPAFSFIDKILSLQQIQEKYIVFLDTDTYVNCPVYELFDLLVKFDLACSRAPVRNGFPVDVPDVFSEPNTGVICFKNSLRIRRLFENWRACYLRQIQEQSPPHDQSSFRKVLWDSDINFYMLPPEYNCRLVFPTYINGHVKIYHCRFIDVEKVSETLNSITTRVGHTVYLPFPDADIIVGDGIHLRISEDLLNAWAAYLVEELKNTGQSVLNNLLASLALFSKGNVDRAGIYRKIATDLMGGDTPFLRLFYSRLLKSGDVDGAFEAISLCLSREPDDPFSHYALSRAFAQTDRIEEAMEEAIRAIRIKGHNARFHHHLGNLLLRTGELEKAEDSFRRAIELNPDVPEFFRQLSTALARQNKLTDAILEARNAVRLDAGNHRYHDYLDTLILKKEANATSIK